MLKLTTGILIASAVAAQTPKLMDWPDLLNRPLPAADAHIAYGNGPEQFGELFLPKGDGPFPVVLMIHGGCWLSNVAKLSVMNYVADDLRKRGIAVWNIEYRGVDRPGGGYPGTFQDVAAAADLLRELGPKYRLRTERVVAVGHSAGGHLAPWLAGRTAIPPSSPLHAAQPLAIAAAISLGGLPDLEDARARGEDACGAETIDRLTGKNFGDTSPFRLGKTAARQVLVNGDRDPIAPPAVGSSYAGKIRKNGQVIELKVIPMTGHAELIAPETAAWRAAVDSIQAALRGAN